MTRYTRRNLVGSAGVGLATLAAPSVARAQTRRWRMVTSWPKRLPGPGMSAERVAERIAALSGGRLTMTVHAAGEVVPAFEVLDAVGGGVAEIGHTASFYWQGKQPAAARRCGTSSMRRSASSRSWAATPVSAWAAGSAARSTAAATSAA